MLANNYVINVNSNENSYRMIIGESALCFDFDLKGIFKFKKGDNMRKSLISFFMIVVLCMLGTASVFAVGITHNWGNYKNRTYGGSETGNRVNVSISGSLTNSQTITTHYNKMANQQPLFCYASVEEYHYETLTAAAIKYGLTPASSSQVTDSIVRHPSSSAYSYKHKGQCYSSMSSNPTIAMNAPLIDEIIYYITQ